MLVTLWGLRLALYLGRRTFGHEEDRRYQRIRARNEPGFTWKSLYLVFGLQAVLAWIISLPLLGGIAGDSTPLGWLDAAGIGLWAVGLVFRGRRRPATGALQGRPGQRRQGDGPGPVAPDPPPQLLRRLLHLVGLLPGGAGGRRLVDAARARR